QQFSCINPIHCPCAGSFQGKYIESEITNENFSAIPWTIMRQETRLEPDERDCHGGPDSRTVHPAGIAAQSAWNIEREYGQIQGINCIDQSKVFPLQIASLPAIETNTEQPVYHCVPFFIFRDPVSYLASRSEPGIQCSLGIT